MPNDESPASSGEFKEYGKAKLTINGSSIESNVYMNSTQDELFIDTGSLRKDGQRLTGYPVNVLDNGLKNTATCSSSITYIKGEGEKGILLYRGFPVESLSSSCSYLEVAYLLFTGNLPNVEKLRDFSRDVKENSMLSEQFSNLCDIFPRETHPMTLLSSLITSLSAQYDNIDLKNEEERLRIYKVALGLMPTLVAMVYKFSIGEPYVSPSIDLSYVANFLNMMFWSSLNENEPNPILVNAMEQILLLHADHEQNASTSAMRMVGSTDAQPFSCLQAALSALSGPLHGGANEACLKMLEDIGDQNNIDDFIIKVKKKQARLMGFGHRVYHTKDPRAVIMREICHEVLRVQKLDDPIFSLALELEKRALQDEYFISRKLYPNVDFYSGITLRALGIPSEMFTAIFALGRVAGWFSHWNEMHQDAKKVLCRPRQHYTGPGTRNPNL
ncbi:MAG: citrate synthase [Pseudomonadota bacterium]|nr:citrate synthase [Pseudomonadota bacterium]